MNAQYRLKMLDRQRWCVELRHRDTLLLTSATYARREQALAVVEQLRRQLQDDQRIVRMTVGADMHRFEVRGEAGEVLAQSGHYDDDWHMEAALVQARMVGPHGVLAQE